MATTERKRPVISDGLPSQLPDIDPEETTEWVESLDGVIDERGAKRARYVMLRLLERARERQVGVPPLTTTDYINTIPPEAEPWFPGDEHVERRIRAYIRWNAAMLVHRAQRPGIGVGGHISTYASSASLYEVGFNHFFRGKDHPGGGDQIYYQGHASPGMYARAYLEGRLTEHQLDGFRQELSHPGGGLPSYPHPRLMPDFWEFPTVSMGLGGLNAIYQARFNRYLHNRGIKDTSEQHVWSFLGDGEMDEPETLGAIGVAAREELDNLTFVINCNLQRLDGPVRGNGKVIQELEAFFRGAGWNVIKVVWGREWDPLLAADTDGALVNLMNVTPRRRLPDLQGRRRRVRPGALLRPRPAHPQDGRGLHRRPDLEPQARRPRLPQALRGLPGGDEPHRAADGDPRQDGQGLDARLALRGPQRDAPDEEADAGRPQGLPRPALPGHPGLGAGGRPVPAAVLPPGRELRRDRVHEGAPRGARRVPAVPADVAPTKLDLPGDARVRGRRSEGSGKQKIATTMAFVRLLKDLMQDKDVRRALGADHPGRGAHVRHGLAVPDREDLLAARAELHAGRPGAVPVLPGGRPPGRSCTRASTRSARSRRSRPPARPTPRTASR